VRNLPDVRVSAGVTHAYMGGKAGKDITADVLQAIEGDAVQAREVREAGNACGRDAGALPELELFKRFYASKDLEAAVG
jgi:hypothetical protein